ncbi:unnamed protein product [Penicillium salamii]|uniref:Uncharacterized protein n=1 Tax=Penicillium salamii TaxID=1612424 RepID=A0A9W4JHE6_9EURO|nr:unnamed protein product [Penicillium salamii]
MEWWPQGLKPNQKRKGGVTSPLVLIISNIHHIPDDADGRHLLTLLQQPAELWAANGLATLFFTSDEYHSVEALRLHATRMQMLNVQDIPRDLAMLSLGAYRKARHDQEAPLDLLDGIYDRVGGRLVFLDQIARSSDMVKAADAICRLEKHWLLSPFQVLDSRKGYGR